MKTMIRSSSILTRGGNWRHTRVGVLGLGRSGLAAVEMLLDQQCRLVLVDDQDPEIPGVLQRRLEEGSHSVFTGGKGFDQAAIENLDALIVSPGVPTGHSLIEAAEQASIPVWSELELASRRIEGSMILVTGTNGKSTTVTLIHHLLQTAGRPSLLAGNIGTALSSVVDQADSETVVVVEASSFQLERIETLHPFVAVLLNLAPDHLNRYDTMTAYAEAKRRMLENATERDFFIFPADDSMAQKWSAVCSSRKLSFRPSENPAGEDGTSLENGWLVQRSGGRAERVLPASTLPLLGRHNLLNALAALAALIPFNLSRDALAKGLRTFHGLPHRMEAVGEIDGVLYVNDSKATNVHALLAALRGLSGPVVLLLGGQGKGEDYSPLSDAMGTVRVAICYGEEGAVLEEALKGAVDLHRAGPLESAVDLARDLARVGDTVLLSPACTSYDEFNSFEERGEAFKAQVSGWKEGTR